MKSASHLVCVGVPVSLEKRMTVYNQLMDDRLRRMLMGDPPFSQLYQMMAYHFGWLDESLRPQTGRPGKRIRPCLCFLACEAVGGSPRDALPGALAIELIHNFSLVHDDIEDVSILRRNRPAVWSIWGISQGVNVGDGLFALAHLALTGGDVPPSRMSAAVRALGKTCLALCEGQFLDMRLENVPAIGLDNYMTMIRGKSGALFGCAAQLGGLLGGARTRTVAQLNDFGCVLGEAFQMQDDILGVWGQRSRTGKEASDIRYRKRGLPAVIAWETATGGDLERLSELYQNADPLSSGEVEWVRDLFTRLKVRERAEALADERLKCAEKLLDETVPERDRTEPLRQLVRDLSRRSA